MLERLKSYMLTEIIKILAIPFIGTALGAATVFFVNKNINSSFAISMNGFAAGIMIAASVWSLIIPALELASDVKYPFIPAALGLWMGILFFFFTDKLILFGSKRLSYVGGEFRSKVLPLLAVTIHNIPEGMALGVVFAAWASGNDVLEYSAILALAIGIGVQNFPEGSIISVPLHVKGTGKTKAFLLGIVSAVLETVGGVITVLASSYLIGILPYLMCFAAGAMIYIVIGELCPEMNEGENSDIGIMMFSFGFSLMMVLDVALG